MNSDMSGSPLFARQSANIFAIIGIVLVILFVMFALYMLIRRMQTYKNSPEYIEKQRNRPTTYSNVCETAKKSGLLREEREFLWQICRENKTPNIYYFAHDLQAIETLFHTEYLKLNQTGNEDGKSLLFSIRAKIINIFDQAPAMTQSKIIDAGTVFTYTASKGIHYQLTLSENTDEGLVLSMPVNFLNSGDKPESLTKINLVFNGKGDVPYSMDTRVIRYQIGKKGDDEMIVVHTDRLQQLQRRQAARIDVVQPCKFSPVKVENSGKGKMAKVSYTPSQKKYDGTLIDISTGGCRIITSLPIQPQQNIYVEGLFNGKVTDSAIGIILRNTKRRDNQYVLHIRFIKIEKAVVNRINALTYGYDLPLPKASS